MKLLIISDGHGDIKKIDKLNTIASTFDAVIFAGDFAAFNKSETALPFLQKLENLHKNIFAVLGNCDEPDFEFELQKRNISISSNYKTFNGFNFIGSGGGSKFSGVTPYEREDSELLEDLKSSVEKCGFNNDNGLIIICHNPPYGTKVDTIQGGIHVGSKGITSFIEKYKPVLVVSGHIHESYAVDTIGSSLLVNPGALMDGRYAIAEIIKTKEGFKVNAELKTLD